MANFYTDNPDLRHHLSHPLMEKIVALTDRDYTDADKFDYAPVDFADAMDNYDKVLEIVGDICGGKIAENAEAVDHQGASCSDGHAHYADKTVENLDITRKAGLMGMSMPRRLGGLNFPITPYIMAADIPDSRTCGDFRTAPRPSTNSAAKNRNRNISHAYVRARPCLWTSPSPTQALTFSR